MEKTVAISQSNYIPWRGFFDFIHSVDEFILYDDVQYTRRDWRNRNRIKTKNGARWLTIPVMVKGKFSQKIRETVVNDPAWGKTHLDTLRSHYAQAQHFRDYLDLFAELYLNCRFTHLSEINRVFLEAVCRVLGISTRFSWSSDYRIEGDKTERLVNLCKQAGAAHYLTGPAAKAYLEEELFARAGIAVSYMDYSGYPEYPQLFPPFDPALSIVDLLFNVGPNAPQYMKSF